MTERVQFAIVGGGPAGLSAAIAAADAGVKVTLLDEQHTAGGQLRYRLGTIRYAGNVDFFPPRLASELAERARSLGVELRTRHRVWGLFPGLQIGVEHGNTSSVIEADRILLANGSIDRALPFPGGSLPGVFTARAVQILLNTQFVLPGKRFAVIADEPGVGELVHEITLAGGEVVAVLTATSDSLSVSGAEGVAQITSADFAGDVDVVVVSAGRLADAGLALMAECAAGYSATFGGFVPRTDPTLQTSVSGLYVAGDCAGPSTPEIALIEGEYAGLSIAHSLGLIDDAALAEARSRYHDEAAGRITDLRAIEGDFVQVDRVPMGSQE